ncbi:Protein of unknown function [Pyronema omphalodes CBS 100304]|uniref:Uncharacterized protein n=1 Tax=Pyronema omphalodes (strain CBS 100304) TaxID=1076935 RepID=U4LRW8_PYROM|nr:Protein of unknown function [Pyronema omphalodes CBS 100304]
MRSDSSYLTARVLPATDMGATWIVAYPDACGYNSTANGTMYDLCTSQRGAEANVLPSRTSYERIESQARPMGYLYKQLLSSVVSLSTFRAGDFNNSYIMHLFIKDRVIEG